MTVDPVEIDHLRKKMTKTKTKCLHCGKKSETETMLNGLYCAKCTQMLGESMGCHGDYGLRGSRKCVIPGCLNHTDEGVFVGDLCAPCHSYIVRNEGVHSQAYRNELFKSDLRIIGSYFRAVPDLRLEIAPDGRIKISLSKRGMI